MKKLVYLLVYTLPISTLAQFHLPVLELSVKSGVTKTTDLGDAVLVDLRSEVNIHINQYVSAGGFYSRSLFGEDEENDNLDISSELKSLSYGVRIRLSTGRIYKFRPYVFLTLSKLEIVEKVTDNLNFAGDWTGITYGGGLMIRLSNRLYLNLIEIEYIPAKDAFFFLPPDLNFISFRFGVNYTLGKKR